MLHFSNFYRQAFFASVVVFCSLGASHSEAQQIVNLPSLPDLKLPRLSVEPDYPRLTKLILEKMQLGYPLRCIESEALLGKVECKDKMRAFEAARVRLSAQALAKALEVAGIGMPRSFVESFILRDIQSAGLDLSIVSPAIQLARLSSSEYSYFGERSRTIYELSNLALGYIYAPEFLVGRETKPLSKFDNECYTLDRSIEVDIQLFDYRHSQFSGMDPSHSINIVDRSGRAYSFAALFKNRLGGNEFLQNLYNFTQNPASHRVGGHFVTHGVPLMDVTQFQFGFYFSFNVVEQHVYDFVDFFGPVKWASNKTDTLQAHFSGPVPFEFYSSGGAVGHGMRGSSSRRCKMLCEHLLPSHKKSRTEKWKNLRKAAKRAARAEFKRKIQFWRKQSIPSPRKTYDVFDKIIDATLNNTSIGIMCVEACSLNDRLLAAEGRSSQLGAEQSILGKKSASLKLEISEIDSRIKALNKKLDSLNDDFDKAKSNVETTENNPKATDKEIEVARKKQDDIDQERETREKEYSDKQDEKIEKEKELKEVKSKSEDKAKEVAEAKSEVKELMAQKEEKLKEIESPKQQQMSCDSPGFVRPADTKCVYVNGKPTLVADQDAIDYKLYLRTCAYIKLSPGANCVIIGGKPVIVSIKSIEQLAFNGYRSTRHCNFMRLTVGSECKMVDGNPVVTNSFDQFDEYPEFRVSFCNYAKVTPGSVCIDGPGGPTIYTYGHSNSQFVNIFTQEEKDLCQLLLNGSLQVRNDDSIGIGALSNPKKYYLPEVWPEFQGFALPRQIGPDVLP